MRFSPFIAATVIGVLTSSCTLLENAMQFKQEVDGRIGAFKQNNTGDCFFLASLLALAQDPDGRKLIASAFQKNAQINTWQITFPNLPDHPAAVSEQDTRTYRLTDSDGDGLSAPAKGDPDIKMLEIAADKIWLKHIKAEGLWDDVPMNALYMFTEAEQLLLWNRSQAEKAHVQDIDKYRRIPQGLIKEIAVSTPAAAEYWLKQIISADNDGISMVLIDYKNYHAVAVKHIDFESNSYRFIDTSSNTLHEAELQPLLRGMANGLYAVNYLEIPSSL